MRGDGSAVVGFGGPPAHIALLRELVVDRRRWMPAEQFEDGLAAANLLPGPASTQLAIYTAWRTRGLAGALVGGLAFIVPGLVLIVALAALFLGSPPDWIRGAGAGAGAAVAAVAVHAGLQLLRPAWGRVGADVRRRFVAYALLGAVAAATLGPWLVAVLLACGAVEVGWRRLSSSGLSIGPFPALVVAAATGGTLASVSWVAFKVGALSYGGGFVIIPLMQADAVERYGWMTDTEFLNAVALGQVTPGPVMHTVAVVGYAAAGVPGAALAALVAFAPSFAFVLARRPELRPLPRERRRAALLRRRRACRDRRDPRLRDPALAGAAGDVAVGRAGRRCCLALRAPTRSRPHAARGRCGGSRCRAPRRTAHRMSYQPRVPGSPLNGPTTSDVIQPP